MEVIVDDSQLSLAIGKRGQNVRLAAKLLGWKIDIKSEEEKRQEMQNAITLLSTGAPVSTLIDYGLAESTVDALVTGDIGTVEKLGGMTPEQLEAIPGIDAQAIARIQQAINAYYGQEYATEGEAPASAEAPVEGEAGAELPEVSAETAEGSGEPAAEPAETEAAAAAPEPANDEIVEDAASGTIVEPAEQA
jgi:N utilization substance protein A